MAPEHRIVDNPAESRFELLVDGELAGWLAYRPGEGRVLVLTHTQVLEGHEGEGFGGVLVRGALEAVAASGRTALPTCPYVVRYIDRHPELHASLDPSARPR
jgi:hypothetical protein